MDKMLVVIFENEEGAYDGVKALEGLHKDAKITLYSSAVIRKTTDGRINHLDSAQREPIGTAAGTLTGALIGVLGGPVGVAVGAYAGMVGGLAYDLAKIGVSDDFIDEVGEYLLPGKVAIVAEIDEEGVLPVDMEMESNGGIVFRRGRGDIVDVQLERDADILDAEILELEAEFKSANAEEKARLQKKIDAAKAKIEANQAKNRAAAEDLKREMDAKLNSLKEQIKTANANAKTKLEKRTTEVKADYQSRIDNLQKSWERAKEAGAKWRYAQTHV